MFRNRSFCLHSKAEKRNGYIFEIDQCFFRKAIMLQNNILFLFALDDCTQMYQPMFSLKCIILFHTQLLDSRGFDIQLDSNCRANWKYCLCLLSVPLEYF